MNEESLVEGVIFRLDFEVFLGYREAVLKWEDIPEGSSGQRVGQRQGVSKKKKKKKLSRKSQSRPTKCDINQKLEYALNVL